MAELKVTSTAFKEGELIPQEYTCDGKDISPDLAWAGAPAGAKSIVLISDDPDAPMGTWAHWVVINIPPEAKGLAAGASPTGVMPKGCLETATNFSQPGYGGPCPPGGTHRYYFKVYALDSVLNLAVKARKAEVESAMQGHILAQGQLMGKYRRNR
jgi:Raf kinase inhibitor-like YbhB/YbcL family protein